MASAHKLAAEAAAPPTHAILDLQTSQPSVQTINTNGTMVFCGRGPSVPPNERAFHQQAQDLLVRFPTANAFIEEHLCPTLEEACDKYGQTPQTATMRAFLHMLRYPEKLKYIKEEEEEEGYGTLLNIPSQVEAQEAAQASYTRVEDAASPPRKRKRHDSAAQATPRVTSDAQSEDGPARPILERFCGEGDTVLSVDDQDKIVSQLLSSIQSYAAEYEQSGPAFPLKWQGRDEGGRRVSFHSDDLEAVLRDPFSKGKKLAQRLEALLSKFVRWNPDLLDLQAYYKPYAPGPYESTLDILRSNDGMSLPVFSSETRDQICDKIYQAVLARVRQLAPDSALLRHATVSDMPRTKKARMRDSGKGIAQWKLSDIPQDVKYALVEARDDEDIQFNFRELLKRSVGENAPPEQALADLEVQVYQLARKEKKAWPELVW